MTKKINEILNKLDRIFKISLLEQEEEKPTTEEVPTETPPPDTEEVPGMGGMGGMGGEEKSNFNMSTLGRIYELKKIYSRLVSIESRLGDSSDMELMKVRDYVLQAIELFELLSSNLEKFEKNLNEIIVMFYKFIERVYIIVDKYYKRKEKEDSKNK